jgi:hypothetical protein
MADFPTVGELNPQFMFTTEAIQSFQQSQRTGDTDIITHQTMALEKLQGQLRWSEVTLNAMVVEIVTPVGGAPALGTTSESKEKFNRWQVRAYIPALRLPPPTNFQKGELSPEDRAKLDMQHIFTAVNEELPLPKLGQIIRVQYPNKKIDNRRGICLGIVSTAASTENYSDPTSGKQAMAGGNVSKQTPQARSKWPSIPTLNKAYQTAMKNSPEKYNAEIIYGGFDHWYGKRNKNGVFIPKAVSKKGHTQKPFRKKVTGFIVHDPDSKYHTRVGKRKAYGSTPHSAGIPARSEELRFLSQPSFKDVTFWMSRSGIAMQPHLSIEFNLPHATAFNSRTIGMELHVWPVVWGNDRQKKQWRRVKDLVKRGYVVVAAAGGYTDKLKWTEDDAKTMMLHGELVPTDEKLTNDQLTKKHTDDLNQSLFILPKGTTIGWASGKNPIYILPSLKQCEGTFQLINAINKVTDDRLLKIPMEFPGSVAEDNPKGWKWNRVGPNKASKVIAQGLLAYPVKYQQDYAAFLKAAEVFLDRSIILTDPKHHNTIEKHLHAKAKKLGAAQGPPPKAPKKPKKKTQTPASWAEYMGSLKGWKKSLEAYTKKKAAWSKPYKAALKLEGHFDELSEASYNAWWRKNIASDGTGTPIPWVKGITAHARLHHGDGDMIEYYCAGRAKGFSPRKAFHAMVYALVTTRRKVTSRPNKSMWENGAKLESVGGKKLKDVDLDSYTLSATEMRKLIDEEWPKILKKRGYDSTMISDATTPLDSKPIDPKVVVVSAPEKDLA